MHNPIYFPALFALVSTTFAATDTPRPHPGPSTHLYVCTDASFKGTCINVPLEVSTCHNMTDTWNDKISSAGPDEGTFCTLYSEFDCWGKALPFTYPGIRRLARYGYDDTVSSVRCDYITSYKDHP